MSRKSELLKLAQLFHSQASLTLDRATKQALRKIGDHYQHEAKQLQGQASSDSDTKRPNDKRLGRHDKRAA
jgi:hypothetical protein